MAVKTGYKTLDLTALAERMDAQGAAHVANVARDPSGQIELACCCDHCRDPQA